MCLGILSWMLVAKQGAASCCVVRQVKHMNPCSTFRSWYCAGTLVGQRSKTDAAVQAYMPNLDAIIYSFGAP